MNWTPTDQFGNLFMAESEATSGEQLLQDLSSMIEEVLARGATEGEFAVDTEFGQISAPSEYAVTHVMNVAWISERSESEGSESVASEIQALVGQALESTNGSFKARGPF